MTTSPAGCASSTTLNVAVVPDSATDTDVVDNVNPGVPGVAATAGARFPEESSFDTNTLVKSTQMMSLKHNCTYRP